MESIQPTRWNRRLPKERPRELTTYSCRRVCVVSQICGPLAERAWEDFHVQPHHPDITLYGGDRDQFEYLRSGFQGDLNCLQPEAWWFLGQKEVQEQIDRVAQALLERKRLTRDEVVEIARFTERLCSSDWL